ncbi:toxin-antitoxin system YwqK family antitoxin, partial [bacterium]|nr:toxin-antitoxin system YwqK family antitoxin [bacterium]
VSGQKPGGAAAASIPSASIPPGAKKYETNNRVYYMLDGKAVGLEQEWWGDDKQRLYKEFLHADLGFWKMYYKSGQLNFLVCFKNGDHNYKHGLQESYNEDGTKVHWTICDENSWVAQKTWYDDGTLEYEATFDLKNLWSKTYYKNGSPDYERYEKSINNQAVAHGKTIHWYENGKKSYETSHKEGIAHGKSIGWYEDGKKAGESSHKNGKLHGQEVHYYENGKKEWLKSYKEGEPHGPWKDWDEDGNPKKEGYCKDGKTHGKEIWYHKQSSQPKWVAYYKNGKLEGQYTVYYKNGALERESQYVNDKKEGEFRYYNKDGTLRKREIFSDDSKLKTYYEDR